MFDDLVEFVVPEARVETNLLFGRNVSRMAVKQNYQAYMGKFRTKPLVAATQLSSAHVDSCLHCQDDRHELPDCNSFAKLPHQDKIAVIRGSALCYACLK